MQRIHDSLRSAFQRNRLVFWYDTEGEWAEIVDAYSDGSVEKLKVVGNEFGTKVHIVRSAPDAKFLVYIPSARPSDGKNWLLDLLLQAYEFRADKASLALQDAGLPQEFHYLAEEHAAFFQGGKRVQALKELAHKDDQARDLRLKMMAVLASTSVETDAMLLRFLGQALETDADDPVEAWLGAARLVDAFWREVAKAFGYSSESPSIRDFAVSLFRGANPLNRQATQHPHAKVFMQRWKDSQAHCASFRQWAQQLEREFQVRTALDGLDERTDLGDWDTFEAFDKYTIQRLCQSFEKGTTAIDLRAVIQQRRGSYWQEQHAAGYAALEHAVELRELLASAELTMDSVATGFARYVASWWKIDRAYRLCTMNLRRYAQPQVMEKIRQWVEKAYVNNFLLTLTDRWGDQVRHLDVWECPEVYPQRRFFERHVKPITAKNQKVFVIISDALRYEAAADFADRIRAANRWNAEVEALFGSLPTYTQLGMATLLPGKQWDLEPSSANVTVDDRSAVGTSNRAEILRRAHGVTATALQAEDFLELNTKTEGRELMRQHDVIYIFHNHIDKVGDSAGTEAKTLDAVEQAFGELEQIIRKVANINGTHMLITSDHGFLFQQDDVAEGDMTPLPKASEWSYRNRRFALGKGIEPGPQVKIFSAEALRLGGDFSAAFPLSLGRFPLQGSGKRFVHGGLSLQEIVIPVIKIHKARADDTERVDVELLRVPAKITTGQVALSLFQDRPAVDKALPRTLRVGVFSKDGKVLSELKTQTFDSKETEPRNRESTMVLMLSNEADAYNNCEVVIRLEETVPGTNQMVTYKAHGLKLQKPFASDFDDD